MQQSGRYLPEWPEFDAIAGRESRKRAGPPIRTGTIVRAVLRAFLGLTSEAQGKALDKAFLAQNKARKILPKSD
jgi:hypothetical protein